MGPSRDELEKFNMSAARSQRLSRAFLTRCRFAPVKAQIWAQALVLRPLLCRPTVSDSSHPAHGLTGCLLVEESERPAGEAGAGCTDGAFSRRFEPAHDDGHDLYQHWQLRVECWRTPLATN